MKVEKKKLEEKSNLRKYLAKNPESIGKGIKILKENLSSEAVGNIDLLACNSERTVTVIDLSIKEEYSLLNRGLAHYEWINSHKHLMKELYPINPDNEVELILVAPYFSDDIIRICRHLEVNLRLIGYKPIKMKEEVGIITKNIKITS